MRKGRDEEVTVADIPPGFSHDQLYISEDCSLFLIGRDWEPTVITDGEDNVVTDGTSTDGSTVHTPTSWYDKYGDGGDPTYSGEDQMQISVALDFTDSFFLYNNCYETIPHKHYYTTREEYDNAWTAFLNTNAALRDGFFEVYYNRVEAPMLDAWEKADPDGFALYAIGRAVDSVLQANPTLSNVIELTDIAYVILTEDDPSAPTVIDPQNPSHQEYKDLWLAIQDMVAKRV